MVEFNGTLYSYVHNLQGDIVGIVDSSGSLVVEYKYDAWGKPTLVRTLTTAYEALAELNPFRYRGYVFDGETALYYLRNRYYSSICCRFINADHRAGRRGDIFSHNLFAYCDNKPILCLDKSGAGKTYVFYYYFPGSDAPLKDEAMNSPYFDSSDTENVMMIDVKTSQDFVNAWNSMEGEIDDVYLYLHGGAGYFQLDDDKIGIGDEFDYQLDELEEKNISGVVYDFACHGADIYNGTSVAEKLAIKTKATVIACDVGVSYRSDSFVSKIIMGNSWHARTETKHLIFGSHWYRYTYNSGRVRRTVYPAMRRFTKKWGLLSL